MPLTLRLIRHGATAFNEAGRFQGWSDPSLSSSGRRAVMRLARELREAEGGHGEAKERARQMVASSDLRRARETATLLFPDLPVRADARLRELHFGRFEGWTPAEAEERWPRAYRAWLEDPEGAPPPSGESMYHFQKRIHGWASELPPGGTVTVVGHGGTIGVLLTLLLRPDDPARDCIPTPAGAIRLRIARGIPSPELSDWRLL